jgi:hypothetical protein
MVRYNAYGMPVGGILPGLVDPFYGQGNKKGRKNFKTSVIRIAEENARTKNGWRCANPSCKKEYSDRAMFDIGHLNGKNSDNRPENCGLLCRSCNVKQGNKSLQQYKKLKERVGKNAHHRKVRKTPKKKHLRRQEDSMTDVLFGGRRPRQPVWGF